MSASASRAIGTRNVLNTVNGNSPTAAAANTGNNVRAIRKSDGNASAPGSLIATTFPKPVRTTAAHRGGATLGIATPDQWTPAPAQKDRPVTRASRARTCRSAAAASNSMARRCSACMKRVQRSGLPSTISTTGPSPGTTRRPSRIRPAGAKSDPIEAVRVARDALARTHLARPRTGPERAAAACPAQPRQATDRATSDDQRLPRALVDACYG